MPAGNCIIGIFNFFAALKIISSLLGSAVSSYVIEETLLLIKNFSILLIEENFENL